jgi:hypothetical protein
MARFNEILAGRFNRALQKFLGIKGGPPAPQLASEITTNLQFNQMGADFRLLEGWERFWGFVAAGPSVGNNNGIQLRNPITSGIVAVLEKISFFQNGADFLNVTVAHAGGPQADLTNIAATDRIDNRGRQFSTLVLSTFSPAGQLAIQTQRWSGNTANLEVSEILTEDQELLMLPGDVMRFTTIGANLITVMNFIWRERALEESETK